MRPLGDRIIVRPDSAAEVRESGIVIPDSAQEKPHRGEVVATGPKVEGVAEGETVLYSKYGGTELTVDSQDLVVLREADVLAVV